MTTSPILPTIQSPQDLQQLSLPKLERLAAEMREVLCNLVSARSAHFASNLGVVELCLALHQTFDFLHDRLIWDTGHQIYPHKLITGRFPQFGTIRTKGGLMGYPNPEESDFDLFVTGHAGSSVSTAIGLASGDALARPDEDRWSVAVIGDGAFPSGIVYEAMNNAGQFGKRLLVILNDNKMSICPRVGGMADYLDRLRMNRMYSGLKEDVVSVLSKVPLLGDPVERFLAQLKEAAKAGIHGGMFFEDLGFRYFGPIDGHNIGLLRKYLRMAKAADGPILLHVVTEKGHGFTPAAADPVLFHAPPQFERKADEVVRMNSGGGRSFTHVAAQAIFDQMTADPRVTVITAAMCQGNKLEKVRDAFPDRFFDTGICEGHAVAFAAGQAKAGLRPIVDIYSTFLQRSYDQIFQEVALQNLPVTFMLDRGGLAGPDGPTHHGVFDLGYLRVFPNLAVMIPGDEADLQQMLALALRHDGPSAIRYPKASANTLPGDRPPVEFGKCEVLSQGDDGTIICGGALLGECLEAANQLRREGFSVGVINARFLKPLDTDTILRAIRATSFAVTVEEAALMGGFGSAVLEAASEAGVDASRVRRLGIPDHFVEHGERGELLADLGLDTAGIVAACRALAKSSHLTSGQPWQPTQEHAALILADGSRPEMRATVERLRPVIEKHLTIAAVSFDFEADLDTSNADFVIVFGGDGSILRAARQMGHQQRPVLGVNLGRLGFLAALQPTQLDQALPEIAAGRHLVNEHLMFECTHLRGGKPLCQVLGLNEAEVLAGPPFTMLDVQLYVDGELVTTYSCDGLIVSTPIGSTAHSLSAGGPILRNNLQAFVVSPISPHTLTNRPVVDSADRTIEIAVPKPNPGTSLVVDGRVHGTLEPEDRVRIVRSSANFQTVEVRGQSYYRTLREKLGWGGQLKLN